MNILYTPKGILCVYYTQCATNVEDFVKYFTFNSQSLPFGDEIACEAYML